MQARSKVLLLLLTSRSQLHFLMSWPQKSGAPWRWPQMRADGRELGASKQLVSRRCCKQLENPADLKDLKGGVLKGKTVLVDMDNTIVDWDGEFISRYALASGEDPIEVEQRVRNRQHFEIEMNFDAAGQTKVCEVIASAGFYESLQALPGSVDALQSMVALGVDVKLVTAPHPLCFASCAREKFLSVERLLGGSFLERLGMIKQAKERMTPINTNFQGFCMFLQPTKLQMFLFI